MEKSTSTDKLIESLEYLFKAYGGNEPLKKYIKQGAAKRMILGKESIVDFVFTELLVYYIQANKEMDSPKRSTISWYIRL